LAGPPSSYQPPAAGAWGPPPAPGPYGAPPPGRFPRTAVLVGALLVVAVIAVAVVAALLLPR
ncbi:MAG: hypothetical protein NTW05_14945, partial [Pseudonocardiales bacterium]|nr:hypothetical protein [Pseudonocardiales bacterium]